MLISPGQADSKICPMTLTAHPVDVRAEAFQKCLGRECMAWRWNLHETLGYCGLAGRPFGADR